MADNYLEKRMEDYRAGRLGRPSGHPGSPTSRTTSGRELRVPFPSIRLLIVSPSLSRLAVAIAEIGRSVGARVALLSDDRKQGTSEAQRLGLRFYPALPVEKVMEDLSEKWGGVDVIFHEDSLPELHGRMIHMRDLGGEISDMARFYIFMAHPSNSFFTFS